MSTATSFSSVFLFLFSFLSCSPSSLLVSSTPSFDDIVQVAILSAAQSASDAKLIDNTVESSPPPIIRDASSDNFSISSTGSEGFEGPPSFFMGGIHLSGIQTNIPCEAQIYFFLREPPSIPPALPGQFEPYKSDSFVYTAVASTGESVNLTQAQFDAAGDVIILKGLNTGTRTIAVEVRDTQTGAVGAEVSWPVTITCPDGTGAHSGSGAAEDSGTETAAADAQSGADQPVLDETGSGSETGSGNETGLDPAGTQNVTAINSTGIHHINGSDSASGTTGSARTNGTLNSTSTITTSSTGSASNVSSSDSLPPLSNSTISSLPSPSNSSILESSSTGSESFPSEPPSSSTAASSDLSSTSSPSSSSPSSISSSTGKSGPTIHPNDATMSHVPSLTAWNVAAGLAMLMAGLLM